MSYKNLLCIGGPNDGQIIPNSDRMPVICVPVLTRQSYVALCDVATPPDVNMEYEVTEYRREWLRDFDGTVVNVLVASGVNNPIQRLIAGYKPTNDSAGEA